MANRLAQARFTLDGTEYQLARNDGQNHLHGGPVGFDKVMWDAEPFTADDGVGVKLHYLSPDGDQGFPGALDTTVTYTLSNDNALRVDYAATTGAPTILNLPTTPISNLAGGGNVGEHVVQLGADAFTPVDSTLIPNGELRDVTGTPHDFRTPTAIGARIDQDDEQLKLGGGYDHNWVVRGTPGELRRAARVEAPSTGRVLEVYTTQPGVQLYTGNMMPTVIGKGGQEYTRRTGFCLETQHFPDAPNQPNFPSIVLRPGEQFHETTVFKFGVTE
ncbi:MAG: aldose epimerase family protein [Caldilineaceae bacterium]